MHTSIDSSKLLSSTPFQKLANRGIKKRSTKTSTSINNSISSSNKTNNSDTLLYNIDNSSHVKKLMIKKRKKSHLKGMKVRTLDTYFMKPPSQTPALKKESADSVISLKTVSSDHDLVNETKVQNKITTVTTKPSSTKPVLPPSPKIKSKSDFAAQLPLTPPPEFKPYGPAGHAYVVWEKLAVRDFMIRCKFKREKKLREKFALKYRYCLYIYIFINSIIIIVEKFGGFPNRYKSSINRPQDDWDPRLYKSLLLTGMRILADESDTSHSSMSTSNHSNAKFWRAHLTTLEKHSDGASVGNTMRVATDPVELTRKFLVETLLDPGVPTTTTTTWPTPTEKRGDDDENMSDSENCIENEQDSFAAVVDAAVVGGEFTWLFVVNTVFRLAAQTPTLRNALASQTKAAAEQALKTDLARTKHVMETRIDRLPAVTPFFMSVKDNNNDNDDGGHGSHLTRQEQMAEIRQTYAARVRAIERRHNLRLRVQASRTTPVGCDRAGRVYWHFPYWASTEESVDYFVVAPAAAKPSDVTDYGFSELSIKESATRNDTDGCTEPVDIDMDTTDIVEPNGSTPDTTLESSDLLCLPLTRENLKSLIAWLRSDRPYMPTTSSITTTTEMKKKKEDRGIEVWRLVDYATNLLAMVE